MTETAPLSQTARAQITKLLVMLDDEETPFPQNPFLFPYQNLCVNNYPLTVQESSETSLRISSLRPKSTYCPLRGACPLRKATIDGKAWNPCPPTPGSLPEAPGE
jgi:hypothetical protein